MQSIYKRILENKYDEKLHMKCYEDIYVNKTIFKTLCGTNKLKTPMTQNEFDLYNLISKYDNDETIKGVYLEEYERLRARLQGIRFPEEILIVEPIVTNEMLLRYLSYKHEVLPHNVNLKPDKWNNKRYYTLFNLSKVWDIDKRIVTW